MSDIKKIKDEYLNKLDRDLNVEILNQIKTELFGKNGKISNSFKKLGWECVMASDICEPARKTYEKNHNLKPQGDICEIEPSKLKSYDILTAGFPCFVEGTKVLTYSGYKSIEDVVLNDTLMTHTGKFQKILNLQPKF